MLVRHTNKQKNYCGAYLGLEEFFQTLDLKPSAHINHIVIDHDTRN